MGKALLWLAIIIGAFVYFGNRGASTPATTTSSTPRTSVAQSSPAAPIAPIPGIQWSVQSGTSAIDDSRTVTLRVSSDNQISGRFGGRGHAVLLLRCMENKTNVLISFNDHFMADIQGYGNVTYRIDDRKAATKGFEESTDNKWLGLWSGGSAIPFIKGMFGGEKMVVRATPFNESPVEVTFRIGELESKITPLREACGW